MKIGIDTNTELNINDNLNANANVATSVVTNTNIDEHIVDIDTNAENITRTTTVVTNTVSHKLLFLFICEKVITTILLYYLYQLIIFEQQTYHKKTDVTCFNLKPFIMGSIVTNYYTFAITISYVFMNISECIQQHKINFNSCGLFILLYHFIVLRMLFVFWYIGIVDQLKLQCIHEYKKYYPNALLIYDINISISVCCWIMCLVIPMLRILIPQNVIDYANNMINSILSDTDIETEHNTNANIATNIVIDIETGHNTNTNISTNIVTDIETGHNTNTYTDANSENNIYECCICLNKYKNKYVCLPCCHTDLCIKCYNTLENKKCPICRENIDKCLKIFL